MYLFMVIFLPAMALLFASVSRGRFVFFPKNSLQIFLLGAVVACFYCFFEVLAIASLTYVQISNIAFFSWIRLLFIDILLPAGILFLLLFISSRKTIEEKCHQFFPFLLGFYSIYLVYSSLLKYEKTDSFLLFTKPLLMFCFIFICSQSLLLLVKTARKPDVTNKKLSVALYSVVLIISLVTEPLIQALYLVGKLSFIRTILVVAFELLFIVFFIHTMFYMKKNFQTVNPVAENPVVENAAD
ncbi:MAG: hypothetical protein K6G52_07465 [Treponemataceae bacterium]|nr:hypothetical protein [Treponemataceae bacterium]